MRVREGQFQGILVIDPEAHVGERGLFAEAFQGRWYSEAGSRRGLVRSQPLRPNRICPA
jgi:dTDP-4-dehydrorhamnose 3,5-epimerase-like enzyme